MANDLSQIKAVTFDAAHTLFHPHPSVGAIYREVMLQHGLDYDEAHLEAGFRRAFATQRKDKTVLDGEQREWSYWHSIVRESIREFERQPQDFETLFIDLWNAFSHGSRWEVSDGAIETIEALRHSDIAVALLTNWDSRVRNVIKETSLQGLFDHLFISSEIGHEKPDPEIFLHAQNTLQLGASQILHVGDSLQHDIEGATAAGWKAIRITDEPKNNNGETTNIQRLEQLLPLILPS